MMSAGILAHAQEGQDNNPNTPDKNIEYTVSDSIFIPPLDSLFKWAEEISFQIKERDALVQKTQADTKRVKKQWMNAIKIGGTVNSANNPNLVNQVETGFTYGPYVSFSLYELASNKNLVDVFKAEQQVAVYKREQIVFETRKHVRILYNSLISKKRILKIKSEGVNAAFVHVLMAEKEFKHGAIQLGELSRVTEIYTKSQTEFEVTLNELRTTYELLQQICGGRDFLNE